MASHQSAIGAIRKAVRDGINFGVSKPAQELRRFAVSQREGEKQVDELVAEIALEVKTKMDSMVSQWNSTNTFDALKQSHERKVAAEEQIDKLPNFPGRTKIVAILKRQIEEAGVYRQKMAPVDSNAVWLLGSPGRGRLVMTSTYPAPLQDGDKVFKELPGIYWYDQDNGVLRPTYIEESPIGIGTSPPMTTTVQSTSAKPQSWITDNNMAIFEKDAMAGMNKSYLDKVRHAMRNRKEGH